MAKALEITINELLLLAGYTDTQEHSLAAKLAAEIVERLPPSAQELALDYLQMLEKRFPEVKAGNKVR